MAIVGAPGCGKSTVFEALPCVYKVCAKPQRECTFALAGVLDAEVLLWQEWAWERKTVAWEDMLSLLCGENLGIRLPSAPPVTHKNAAPMFFTAWAPLRMRCADMEQMITMNRAMTERFKTRVWTRPLPMQGRYPTFPQCGCCFGKYILENAQGAPVHDTVQR